MADKPRSEAFYRGQEIWSVLSASEQTAARVLSELKREGFRVSQATAYRWATEWKRVVHAAVDMLAADGTPPPLVESENELVEVGCSLAEKEAERKHAALMESVPADLRDILPARLLPVAHGKGTEAIENAICAISEAVRSRANDAIESEDKNRLRTYVSALGVMSSAIERIAAARATASIAHRSFAEGDRLLAEAEKLRAEAKKFEAEAEVALRGVRAFDAKEISGEVQRVEENNAAKVALEILSGYAANSAQKHS